MTVARTFKKTKKKKQKKRECSVKRGQGIGNSLAQIRNRFGRIRRCLNIKLEHQVQNKETNYATAGCVEIRQWISNSLLPLDKLLLCQCKFHFFILHSVLDFTVVAIHLTSSSRRPITYMYTNMRIKHADVKNINYFRSIGITVTGIERMVT